MCTSQQWSQLHTSNHPFTSYGFLHALEQHGAVDNQLGWQPQHLAIYQADELVAACIGYLTSHSFGDFVYDWNWARLAQMQGIEWYPKWVIEVPYSPVSGDRLHTQNNSSTFKQALINGLIQITQQQQLSCLQVNYCQQHEARLLQQAGFIINPITQLHWHNNHYQSFADFCQALTRKRRKETLRERRKVQQQGITHRWVSGSDATDSDIHIAHSCYQKTFCEYGNYPALTENFWQDICRNLGSAIQFCIAKHADTDIACALFLQSDTRLYGRYWGSLQTIDCLHFETCFYQGIEFCIEHGLQVFEPGAGGGHKLNRGFLPETVYTAHWINDPCLRVTLKEIADEEQLMDRENYQHIQQHSPFKQ